MFTLAVLALLSFSLSVNAQSCDANTPCPASAPCCSEFGFCGTGAAFCLGGCNPLFSFAENSCKPNPVCKTQTYNFQDTSRILMDSTQFDGSPDTYDWVVDGGNVEVKNDELVMILTETNAGTRLSSTRFIHYGTVTATMKTGRWDGVVVGFITMSSIRDEIDWEFPGSATTQGQTNFFWQGANPDGDTSTGLSDTYQNYHDYTIQWSPDSLIFQIDGKTVRTLKASDFVKNGVSQFPSTPSRIQFSLWPAGTPASADGTVKWAGGMINWQDPDYVAAGNQFRTSVKSVSVTCGDPQTPTADQISYVYAADSTANSPQIALSTNSPTLDGTSTSGSDGTTSPDPPSSGSVSASAVVSATKTRMATSYIPSSTSTPKSGGSSGGKSGSGWKSGGDKSHHLFGNGPNAEAAVSGVPSSTPVVSGSGATPTGVSQLPSSTVQPSQTATVSPSSTPKNNSGQKQHINAVSTLLIPLLLVMVSVL
ncbi:concanavalin A-like lectin/glucanase domain-containing protein [Mycena floridula]|nr:concanavalin A-like lectin/glucanase domain-containing protein [Mycena floridula]